MYFKKKKFINEYSLCRYKFFFSTWIKFILLILTVSNISKKIYRLFIVCKNLNCKKVKLMKLQKWIKFNKKKLKLIKNFE